MQQARESLARNGGTVTEEQVVAKANELYSTRYEALVVEEDRRVRFSQYQGQDAMALLTMYGEDPQDINSSVEEPLTYKQAQHDPNHAAEWMAAVDKEYRTCEAKAFEYVPRDSVPSSAEIVDTKWVFKYKPLEHRFKARLTGRGFKQKR